MNEAPPRRVLAAVFLVSLGLLAAQVSVTRLVAYRFLYHFVFFVISLSQLGLAAAGAWIYARRDPRPASGTEVELWLVRLALSVLVTLAFYVGLTPVPDRYFKVTGLPGAVYLLALSFPLIGLNLSGGMVLTLLFSRYRSRMSELYAADLAGAAAGCLASVAVMSVAGPIRAFLLSGLVALLAARVIGRLEAHPAPEEPAAPEPRVSPRFQALVAGLLTAGLAVPWLFDPNLKYGIHRLILRYHWDHLQRTDAVGPSRYLVDGRSGTELAMARSTPERGAADLVEYLLVPPRPRVGILGVGAGPELIDALAAGASKVVAIDLNPAIMTWNRTLDREANQGIFERPEVESYAVEGRHFVQSYPGRFDLLVMFGLDTFSAAAQGTFAMTENFLYTVEAFEDFMERLAPGGVVAVRRWIFDPPRENLRLYTTAEAALRRRGVADPSLHLAVLANRPTYRRRGPESPVVEGYFLASPDPFDEARLARVDELVTRIGWSFVHRPRRRLDNPISEYAHSPDPAGFRASYPYIVEPATDDNPFFFQVYAPWRHLSDQDHWVQVMHQQSTMAMFLTLVVSLVLSAVLLGVPLWLRRRDLASEVGLTRSALYFGCLGFGFMAFELPVIQAMTLFLGHPTYAMSLVLFGLLLAAGTGSSLAARVPRRGVPLVLLTVAFLGAASAWGLTSGLRSLLHLGESSRIGLCLGLLAILGVPLGIPFAAGIREISDRGPHQVAWAWAANGSASVVGSTALMVVLVYAGSRVALGLGALAYLLALGVFPRLAPPERCRGSGPGESDGSRLDPTTGAESGAPEASSPATGTPGTGSGGSAAG